MASSIRVTVWNEFRHEKAEKAIADVYPKGMHVAIAEHLQKCKDMKVVTATLDEPEHGLTQSRLDDTDVLLWWGHMAHGDVKDEIVERVHQRVLAGMGLIVLHSGHFSKIFKKLMGTTCNLKWRECGEREILWVTRPGHPITKGIDDHFILPHEEMYGEYFDVPEPLETVFISSFAGGEVFRSGMTFTRGAGHIFYFRPGHESYPTYRDPNVLRVIENAIRWANPSWPVKPVTFDQRQMGWFEKKK
jgi:trehalose utilization protein